MDIAKLTTELPAWLLFVITFGIGLLSAELGAWVTRKKEKKTNDADKTAPVGSLVGATLGLLAFMLGFTFSFTATRYNERKHLLVNEARAIGTAYLRTDLIPVKQQLETKKLMAEYVNDLVGAATAENRDERIAKIESNGMAIWKHAASLKDETMDAPIRSLYISAVNEMLDMFAERKTVVLSFRIPGAIWIVLLLLYVLNLFLVGSEVSANRGRRFFNVPIMTAGFALIVVLIASMDAATKQGQFTVNRQALIDIQKMIHQQNAKLGIR